MKFKIHTSSSAHQDSRRILEEIERTYGFLPKFFGVLAVLPAAVQFLQSREAKTLLDSRLARQVWSPKASTSM